MAGVDPKYLEPLLGVVFDLDGTLILSNHAFPRMRHEVIRLAELYGVTPGKLSVDQTIPSLLETAVNELERLQTPEPTRFRFEAEVAHQIDAIEMEALPTTRPRPGSAELLAALQDKGYRIAVLTRSSATFARDALKQTGLLPFVAFIRSRSDSGPVKPDPEALLLVLRALEVPPQRAVFVGDHLMDADCAARAGVRFYAVLPTEPGKAGSDVDRFQAAGAAAVAPDLASLGRQLGVAPSAPA
ncbi:MAG TPA: HAD family hydrolase [Thermoplasmata archaeon]|nr:HAD family hydrolase [Thermoplasmata archaeon]